jgi:SAM-dependent methyltransferase
MQDDEDGNLSPFLTFGIELEPEWADLDEHTQVGSALNLPFMPETFDAIVTSPTYGNRLADSHNASDPERRRSYTHDLGRPLHTDNSGSLHWRNGGNGSTDYRAFHEKAWSQAVTVLRPGGLFVLNMCDHVRGGLMQPVTAWHVWCLGRLGLDYMTSSTVQTRKLRQGANGNLREQETIHVFRKPT